MTTYQVLGILRGTTVDGPGLRTSVYLAGCRHRCPGCHNPQSWNPHAGKTMTLEEIMDIIKEEDFDVTITGGDPLFNPESTGVLVREIRKYGYNVWIYTGYKWEEIIADKSLGSAIENADTIVDGRFEASLRDESLFFRGSSNQRIIDVRKSLMTKKIFLKNMPR